MTYFLKMPAKLLTATMVVWTVGATASSASDLIYRPNNPSFGGSPLIDDYLFSSANIQNQFLPDTGGGGGGGVPNINFPPITIDLGGDNGGAPDPQLPATQQPQAGTPVQQQNPN